MNAIAHAQRTHLERTDEKPRVRLVRAPASLVRPNLSSEDQLKFELGYHLARAALEMQS